MPGVSAPSSASNSTYYWHVQTCNTSKCSAWSALRSFRTAILPPINLQPGNVVSPGPVLLTRCPTFTWDAITGASGYILQVSKVATFKTRVLNITTTANSYTSTLDLAANTQYFWQVQTKAANGPSLPSQVLTFTTGKSPTTPTLVSPANKASVSGTTPLLAWKKSSLPAGTLFAYYEVQVATRADFASLSLVVDDKTLYEHQCPAFHHQPQPVRRHHVLLARACRQYRGSLATS